MTIAEMREKCKGTLMRVPKDALLITILILASSLSFGLGFLAGLDAGEEKTILLEGPSFQTASTADGNGVIASKNGTKYYFSWCSGADRIADANRISFISPAAAEAAGFVLSATCSER